MDQDGKIAVRHLSEYLVELADGHVGEVRDGVTAEFDVLSLLPEAVAVACRASGLAAIVGEHDAVLYLILVALDHAEEGVDAYLQFLGHGLLVGIAVPEDVLLLLRQVVVGLKDGELLGALAFAEHALPLAHLFTAPTLDGAVIDG